MKIFYSLTIFWSLLMGFSTVKAASLQETVTRAFEKADVVYIGEYHNVSGHKVVISETLVSLFKSHVIGSFALEGVDGDDNKMLYKYLSDPTAIANSAVEDQYLNYLAGLTDDNRSRCCWGSILHESYRKIFRAMKAVYNDPTLSNQILFCGVDHKDHYNDVYTPEKDFDSLSEEYS
jgi:hypothetical protein